LCTNLTADAALTIKLFYSSKIGAMVRGGKFSRRVTNERNIIIIINNIIIIMRKILMKSQKLAHVSISGNGVG
jgi:hypothetical protein